MRPTNEVDVDARAWARLGLIVRGIVGAFVAVIVLVLLGAFIVGWRTDGFLALTVVCAGPIVAACGFGIVASSLNLMDELRRNQPRGERVGGHLLAVLLLVVIIVASVGSCLLNTFGVIHGQASGAAFIGTGMLAAVIVAFTAIIAFDLV